MYYFYKNQFKIMEFKQWKVKSETLIKTFDNEPQARRQYGKYMSEVEENEEGYTELYARENLNDSWTLIQECRMGDALNDDENEDE